MKPRQVRAYHEQLKVERIYDSVAHFLKDFPVTRHAVYMSVKNGTKIKGCTIEFLPPK